MLPDPIRQPLQHAAIFIAVAAGVGVLLVGPFMDLLIVFGAEFTEDQVGAISTFLQAVVAVTGVGGVAQAVHGKVTPTAAPVLKPGQDVTVWSGDAADESHVASLPGPPAGG